MFDFIFLKFVKSYGKDDVIGCFIDLDSMKIKWSKNGKVFESAYDIQSGLRNYAFFPAVCMKNAEIRFNFGDTAFVYPPKVKLMIFFESLLNLWESESKIQSQYKKYEIHLKQTGNRGYRLESS